MVRERSGGARRGCAQVLAAAVAAGAIAALALWGAWRWRAERRPAAPPVTDIVRARPEIDYFCCLDLTTAAPVPPPEGFDAAGSEVIAETDAGAADAGAAPGEGARPSPMLTPPPPRPRIAPPSPPPPASLSHVDDLAELRRRRLTVPVEGVTRAELRDSFDDLRGGSRTHLAIDIMAPRHRSVVAVEDGTVARLFRSSAGGISLYQFGSDGRFAYYYAHLERYVPGLAEGDAVRRGQVIGYVGTTGNAPRDAPHLHFAIFRLTPDRRWWDGVPINPYPALALPF
jgi:murein DD-endopeptidase MepM/ murein hydrolase activator NlpD